MAPHRIQSWENLVVVDLQGIVCATGKIEGKAIEEAVKAAETEGYRPPASLAANLCEELKAFGNSEECKKIHALIKTWNYSPEVKLTYKTVGENSEFESASIKVRTTHKEDIAPALNLFSKFGKVTAEYIEVFQVPHGGNCEDCKAPLNLPYHYYYWSKVHRCIPCASKQNKEAEDQTKRYSHPENSIVVFVDGSEVDVKRLGKNIQPTTHDEAKDPHSFSCNGCSGGSNGEARYICAGCRREPTGRDFVDFCSACFKILLSGSAEDKAKIEERNKREKHQNSHPLLRVNYNIKGYYEF